MKASCDLLSAAYPALSADGNTAWGGADAQLRSKGVVPRNAFGVLTSLQWGLSRPSALPAFWKRGGHFQQEIEEQRGNPLRKAPKVLSVSPAHPNIEPARANTELPLRTWLEPFLPGFGAGEPSAAQFGQTDPITDTFSGVGAGYE